MQGVEQAPAPKVQEEDEMDFQALREARTIKGELMCMGRTWPDVPYSVGFMSFSLLHRRPQYMCTVGQHVLRYLNGSPDDGLSFKKSERGLKQPLVIGAEL